MRVALFLILLMAFPRVAFPQLNPTLRDMQNSSSLSKMADALEGINNRQKQAEWAESDRQMQMMDLASRAQYCYQLAMTMGQRASAYKGQVDSLTQKLKKAEDHIKKLERDFNATDKAVTKAIKDQDGDALSRYLKDIFRSNSKPNTPIPDIDVKVK